jgi:Na+-transporting methylmalonyl-CoA/oxaloacetate decarboxylase beta subunit
VFNNSLELVISILLKALLSVKTQEFLLFYLSYLPIPFFAAGILFRVPWFTRKLGGLLIALALGVYIILPLIYTLGWYTIDKTSVTVTVVPISANSGLFNTPDVGSLTPFQTPDTSVLFTSYACVEQATYGCARYTENSVGLLDVAGRTFVATLAIPLIAIFATIGFVRQFSPMIGGDAEIAGLTRMI